MCVCLLCLSLYVCVCVYSECVQYVYVCVCVQCARLIVPTIKYLQLTNL